MMEVDKYKKQREKVINHITQRAKLAPQVIDALRKVPRHLFVDKHLQAVSYADEPLPIASGQTISQIYTVAVQTNLLNLDPGNSVLEIGTGSGYQAAILCELGYKVYSIERHEELYHIAKDNLQAVGYNPVLIYGDGFKGLPEHAPFDGILLTCGAPEVPQQLLKQLKVGGRMVAPIGIDLQEMLVIEKVSENDIRITQEGAYRFVPMLPGVIDSSSKSEQ